MHTSVINWFKRVAQKSEFESQVVVDVGGYEVNGSLRDTIMDFYPARYIGTDMRSGPGVDVVVDAVNLTRHFDGIGVVICTEMLEHCEDWRAAITAMKTILAPTGLIYMTARGPGYAKHDFPHDYWRFSPEKVAEIFADFDIAICQPDDDENSPGFFLKARKRSPWVPVDLDAIEVETVI